MKLILLTLFCLAVAVYLLRQAIRDAKVMPKTWDDLRLNRKIDRHICQLIEDLKKKQDSFEGPDEFSPESVFAPTTKSPAWKDYNDQDEVDLSFMLHING